jgi:hypothetical protein
LYLSKLYQNDSPKQQKRPLSGKSSKKNDEPNPWGENFSCNKRDIANNQPTAEEFAEFEAHMDVKRISAKLTAEAKQIKENSPKTKQSIQNTERSPKPVRSSNKVHMLYQSHTYFI